MNDPTMATCIKKFSDPLFTNVDRSTMMSLSPSSKPVILRKMDERPSISNLIETTKGKATFTRRADSIINQDNVKTKTTVSFGK
jgi:hypothetical protein